MSSPDRGLLRVLRASVVTVCVVGLSLAGHVAAGGDVPGPLALAGSMGAVLAYSGALTRSRLSVYELVAVLGAGQVLLHLAFMTSGGEHSGGAAMFAAHAAAALALALTLSVGEDAAWALWCWLRPRLVVPQSDIGSPPSHDECLAATASARASLTWLGTSLTVRGPPAAGRNH